MTLFFFFSARDKGLLLFIAVFDLMFFCVASFILGYHSSFLWVIVEGAGFGLCDLQSRRYLSWREMKRLDWLANGQCETFPKPWMHYTDMWVEFVRTPMCVVYFVLVVVGKLCAVIFP